jgi:serine/threonine-protein kinase
MSPEQAKSEPLDHRSDLYSLAVCMYEILTGERLFVHAGLTTSADEIYSQPIPQISRKVPGLPADFDAILTRALSINPAARYQTAGELQEALMRCAHRNGLLMSAPELSAELKEACGPPDQWRGEEDDEDFGPAQRAGTEVYDPAEDDDGEDDDMLDIPVSGPLSIHSIAARASAAKMQRPKTEVGKFQGVEMTSIINMIDLEQQGSKPLVDLDRPPTLDSNPSLPSVGPMSVPSLASAQQARSDTPLPLDSGHMLPIHQRRASTPEHTAKVPPRQRTREPLIKPWMVIAFILLAAGIAALVVALSGPDLTAGK